MQRKRRWTGKGTGTAVQKRLESKHVSPDDVNQFPGQIRGKTKELEEMGASENKVRLKRGEMFESVFKMAFNPDRPHSMQQSKYSFPKRR